MTRRLDVVRRAWRGLPGLHEDQRAIAFAQTSAGRWCIWLGAVLLLPISPLFTVPAVGLVMLMPGKRRLLLSLVSIATAATYLARKSPARIAYEPAPWLAVALALLGLGGVLYACFLAAKHFNHFPRFVRRRPQIFLHLLTWAILAGVWWLSADGGLWWAVLLLCVATLPYLIWRIGYLLMSGKRGKVSGTRFHDHFFYLFPAFGGGNTPYGKGLDYLSRHEAGHTEAFARSQLAGIKLLCLAMLWKAAKLLMDVLFYGETGLGVPRLEALLDGSRQAPVLMAWLSLYGELVYNTLALAIRGHKIIGALRLFGFNVFRNTYKPLLSESLVDFWGRYYYYFKELLVEFFFYPTFLGSFKSRPRLRILAATFAAAFAGNIYYHVIASRGALLTADFAGIWQAQNPRILYCFLLATGIAISMLRRQAQGSQSSPERASTALGRLRRIAGVWTFYAIIQIWNIHDGSASFRECVNFCLSLFGW